MVFKRLQRFGDEQTFIANVAEPTGLSATTALGFNRATDIIIPTTFSVTGVSATVGFLSGWGSSAWDGGVWGGGVFADPGQTIEPSGVEGTSQQEVRLLLVVLPLPSLVYKVLVNLETRVQFHKT